MEKNWRLFSPPTPFKIYLFLRPSVARPPRKFFKNLPNNSPEMCKKLHVWKLAMAINLLHFLLPTPFKIHLLSKFFSFHLNVKYIASSSCVGSQIEILARASATPVWGQESEIHCFFFFFVSWFWSWPTITSHHSHVGRSYWANITEVTYVLKV